MSTQSALAAAAALVALALAMCTYERWLVARRPHELAWSVSLAMFFVGAAALWFGAANGWGGASFRVFYLFGAVVNVPFLALGTVYLLGDRRRADRWAAAVALASAFAAGVVLEAPLRAPVPADRLPQGSEVFGALPRILAAVASGAGASVVLGGALWSAWRFWRGRGVSSSVPAGRLAGANVLIAAGTLVLGAGGLFNSVLDAMEAFALTLLVGIALLFAGFLVATAGPRIRPVHREAADAVDKEAVVGRVGAKYS
ncbi:MAG: hypothetical protein M3011_14275 [Actinomycetota bacterium]|nr:hypothetical protein [Actinomycetota bacterium]